MATINKIYNYPHVQVTTTALLRTYPEIVDNGATTLFLPFYSKKGLNNEMQKIYNITQFISEYGEPDYEYQGRGILNAYNWLQSGGAIYALRLTAPDTVKATNAASITNFGDAVAEVLAETAVNSDVLVPAVAGTIYKIMTLGDTDWNTYFGTESVTYAAGYIFTANANTAVLSDGGSTAGTVKVVTTMAAQGTISVVAKYPGTYYNNISLYITESVYSTDTVKYADIRILLDDSRVASLSKVKYGDFATVLSSTGYIDVTITPGATATATQTALELDFIAFLTAASASLADSFTIELSTGSDGSFTFEQSLQRFFGSVNTGIITGSVDKSTSTEIGFPVDIEAYSALNWEVADLINIKNYALEADAINNENQVLTTIQGYIKSYVNGLLTIDQMPSTEFDELYWKLDLESEADTYVSAEKILSNKLELPVDVFLDPGYSLASKNLIKTFAEVVRPDVFFYFSIVDFSSNDNGTLSSLGFDGNAEEINQAIYDQKFAVEDIISDTNLWVSPTYFLSSLLPYNDRVYGIQWPTAGLTRGVLSGVKGINLNPTSAQKIASILAKENYVEKDSRGYTFMSQLSGEPEDTAHQYINNIRVVNRMVRDLENLGREYLFEFNDATTLVNMRNALTSYTDNWIQNRTLEYALVQVAKNDYSDEQVDVNLVIKFTGIIDVISIDIVIE